MGWFLNVHAASEKEMLPILLIAGCDGERGVQSSVTVESPEMQSTVIGFSVENSFNIILDIGLPEPESRIEVKLQDACSHQTDFLLFYII